MVDLPSGKMKSREGTVVDADDLIAEMEQTAKVIFTGTRQTRWLYRSSKRRFVSHYWLRSPKVLYIKGRS